MKNPLFLNKTYLILVIILTMSFQTTLRAQEQVPDRTFLQDVRFGGSLGLSFSNGFFNAFLAPKAIYDFNQYTSAGVGLLGSYSDSNRYSAYTVGGSLLGLLRPIPAIQLSAEFEELRVSRDLKLEGSNISESYWYPALFLGAGYTTGNVTVGLRYDVLYDDNKSIYANAFMPFVSVYF